MPSRSAFERAIQLALIAHEGQRDWCGRPFILHPLRVGMSLLKHGELMAAAGVLHDSVEDSNGRVTLEMIETECGVSVAELVRKLTHLDDVSYDDYILDISLVEAATRIKLADLADNMAPDRCMVANPKQEQVLLKHARALQYLRGVAVTNGWTAAA